MSTLTQRDVVAQANQAAAHTHHKLIEVSRQIGRIAESNSHYIAGLASRIERTGKTVGQLTCDELIGLGEEYKAWFNATYAGGAMSLKINATHKISLAEILARQARERGLEPMPLERDLLLKRVGQGGHSGQFLADAFISVYRRTRFTHSLGDLINLDPEGFRLFHEVLHMRHVPCWSDSLLFQIELQIIEILNNEVKK